MLHYDFGEVSWARNCYRACITGFKVCATRVFRGRRRERKMNRVREKRNVWVKKDKERARERTRAMDVVMPDDFKLFGMRFNIRHLVDTCLN